MPRSRSRSRSRSPPRRHQRSNRLALFLCNLPYEMTWLDVKEWFRKEMGDSGYVTLYEQNGKANGIATIEVNLARLCDEAVENLNGMELHGRKIICRRETPRDYEKVSQMDTIGGRKASPPPPRDRAPPIGCTVTPYMLEQAGFQGPITDSVYIHNFEVRWQYLKDHFRRAGNVIKADIVEDKDGKSRGFATVRFEHPFEAVIAVAMFHNQPLDGREMRVRMDKEGKMADPHRPLFPINSRGASAAAEFLAQMTRRVNSRDRDEARNSSHVCDLMFRSRGPLHPPPPHMMHSGSDPRFGVPMDRSGYGMMMDHHRYGPPPGSRIPDYEPPRRRSDYEFGEPLRHRASPTPTRPINEATESILKAAIAGGMPSAQVERYAIQLGISQRDLVRFLDANTPTTAPPKLETLEEPSFSGNRVMVRNIPLAFTDRDLEHYFVGFGQLKDTKICVDANRRSLGYGFVEYFSPGDAKMACTQMNGYTIDGMPMRVAFS